MVPVAIFLAFCVICLVANVYVIISIIKKGDERLEMIIQKTCTNTLGIMLMSLVINIIEQLLNALKGIQAKGANPFFQLSILSFIYLVQLLYYKKKYGS